MFPATLVRWRPPGTRFNPRLSHAAQRGILGGTSLVGSVRCRSVPGLRVFYLCFFAVAAMLPARAYEAESTVAVHCPALLDPATDQVQQNVLVIAEGGLVKQVVPAANDARLPPKT